MFTPLLLLLLFVAPLAIAQSFTEDFESGIPSDWGLFAEGAGTINWAATTDGYESNGAALLNPLLDNIGADNQAAYYLVTPNITLPENGQLHFKSKHDGTGDSNTVYKIMVSTAPQPDIEDFILLDSWTAAEIEDNLDYTSRMVDFSLVGDGFDVYVAFVVENTQTGVDASGTSWFLDDIQLVSACLEVNPDTFDVTGITTDTANISWSHPDATYFDIQIVEAGEAIDENGGDNVNALNYNATGLTPETEYDVHIRTICSGDIPSDWHLVGSFETLKFGVSCEAPIVIDSVPFHLDGNLNEYQNPAVSYDGIGSGCLAGQEGTNHLNGAKIFLSYTPDTDGLINISQFTLPWIPATECYGNAASVALIYEDCSDVGEACLAGLRTTDTDTPAYINNFPVEAGKNYIIVISSSLPIDSGICFEFDLDFSSCAAPSDFVFNNILQENVLVSWNNAGDFADSWEYSVELAGSGEPTGASTAVTTHTDVLLSGLTAGTEYDLYVRSNCGGDIGEWSNAARFITQCDVVELPYFESFLEPNSETSVDCWYTMDGNNDDATWLYQFGGATVALGWDPRPHDDYLISPQVDMSGGVKRIRFEYSSENGSTEFSIKASTDGIGASNFTTTVHPETILPMTGWEIFEEVIVVLPDDLIDVVNLAFHVGANANAGGASRITIRNVYIEEMPACSDPLYPIVQSTTETTANISWDAGYDETQWEVYLKSYHDDAPTASDSGLLVDTNDYELTDLEPSTWYEYYVRAYCSDDEQSEWIGPVEFFTTCVLVEVPYTETFDHSDSETKKFCWELRNDGTDSLVAFNLTEENALVQTPAFGFMGEFDEWLISPQLDLEDEIYNISFEHRALGSIFSPTGRAGVEVLVSTTDTDPSSFTELVPLFYFENPNLETKSIYYQGDNTPVYIAIRIPPYYSGDFTNMEIDNFSVKVLDDCPAPTHLTIEDVTVDSVELSWLAGFEEESWHISVQPRGTGTPIDYSIVDEVNPVFSDLEADTSYEVYVRSDCENSLGESEWIGPVNFKTLCETFDSPFIETFEPDSESINCWTVIDGNNDGEFWKVNSSINPYEGLHSAGVFTGTNGNNNDWLISPTISITEGQRIRFYYSVMDDFFVEDLRVLISTEGTGVESFTTELFNTGENPINNMGYREMVLNIPEGISGEIHVAFHIPYYASMDIYRGQSLFIDNVIIEDKPECPTPTNISFTNITHTSASVSWEANGDETDWEVLIIPEDETTPEDGDVNPDYIYETDSVPFIATDLDIAQRYNVYVRAICSTDISSDWSEPSELITLCDLDDQCMYTITLYSDNSMGVGGGIDVIQNGLVIQTLEFPTGAVVDGVPDPVDYIIYLCRGVQFDLFWDSVGTAPNQYPEARVELYNSEGDLVFNSDSEGGGIGTPRTVIYSGVAQCGEDDCPMPSNIQVDENMELTWDVNGEETQWEIAIKSADDGTIPQSGTVIDQASYTPTDADFVDLNAMTYDFYVRAVCGEDGTSYWAGPYSFVRGDSPATALQIPVNDVEECVDSAYNVSFRNTHLNDIEMDGDFSSDVWLSFTATSPVHVIEVGGFTGSFYISSGDEDYPNIVTTLYKVDGDDLVEMANSKNNVIVAAYSAELEVGAEYMVRLSKVSPEISTRLFTICVTTPEDLCELNTVNYNFSRPVLSFFSGITSIGSQYAVPNWRKNMDSDVGNSIFILEGMNAFMDPYSGSQFVQLTSDEEEFYDEDNHRGMYTDMDTSETTTIDYSFVHAAGNDNSYIQLFAGPVDGPLELVTEILGVKHTWKEEEGIYHVPEGQNETRFLFSVRNFQLGHFLDQANFVPNNSILGEDEVVGCEIDSVVFDAYGVGEWSASEDNPAEVIMSDVESNELTVSGFTAPGEYTFYWNTRYCEDSVTITYEGIEEAPEVDSPVEYCQDAIATPLVASELAGFDLMFYTDEVGGEGVSSITPDTSEPGTTTYYAGYVDADGCEGARVPIEVIVNESFEPITVFEYDAEVYCPSSDAEVLYEEDFTYGGVFTSTPSGLALDAATGAIDSASSTPGIYEVTYTVEGDEELCQLGGTYSVTVEIIGEVAFSITTYCESGRFMLAPEFSSENMDHVSYVWRDATGNTVGTSHTLDFANAMGSQVNLPTTITLTLEVEECEFTESIDLENAMCEIPKGISPNDDGLNDTFDLSGMSVKHITIFNRYGTKVFSKANYTNEWYGQSDKGKEVPDGTYYYVIETSAGESITGWVYVNRAR